MTQAQATRARATRPKAPSTRMRVAARLEVASPVESRSRVPVLTRPSHPSGERLVIAADIASLAVAASLFITILLGTATTPRVLVALVFITTVPGWALIRGAGLAANYAGAAMAIPASLAICAGASTVMVWLGAWHPYVLFGVLSVASAGAIGWALRPHLAPAFVAATVWLRT